MPPRHFTLPPAQTSSARTAMQSFYCALCAKGYARQNEYDAHLSSYDHAHRQRLRDMKAMTRDPQAGERARRAEAKADGIVSIKLGEGGQLPAATAALQTATGFKKGGFKKTGFKNAFAPVGGGDGATTTTTTTTTTSTTTTPRMLGRDADEGAESDSDYDYELYDPAQPTE